jgi:hypothetical protein
MASRPLPRGERGGFVARDEGRLPVPRRQTTALNPMSDPGAGLNLIAIICGPPARPMHKLVKWMSASPKMPNLAIFLLGSSSRATATGPQPFRGKIRHAGLPISGGERRFK